MIDSQGNFVHVAPMAPRSDWDSGFELPWWQNSDDYRIGRLTSSTCHIRIMNMLTQSEDFLEVFRLLKLHTATDCCVLDSLDHTPTITEQHSQKLHTVNIERTMQLYRLICIVWYYQPNRV